jgi:pyridoxal phosphate enzyme (YggS family)
MPSIKDNLRGVHERIQEAANRSGRPASEVSVVGVTKGVPLAKVQEAIEAGVAIFGENYVQEALDKIEAIGRRAAWHMIGHLQKNKARDAVRFFDVIETVDRHELAEILDRRAESENRMLEVFVQVNLVKEDSRFGVDPDKLLFLVEDIAKRTHLRMMGLMTIAPFFEDPEKARPYFRRLRTLGEAVRLEGLVGRERVEISMGMSGDYEVAVEEGASIVRIGTAIFGPRVHT